MTVYHSIFVGGNKLLVGGRVLAGFRLRTEARKHGYETFVIDCAPSLTKDELMLILKKVVSKETLMIGFSMIWMASFMQEIDWVTSDFFKKIREEFPHVKLVSGGPGGPWVMGSEIVYKNTDWTLVGFSDQSYTRLLDLFSGKKDHGLKYNIDPLTKKKIVESDKFHQILDPNDIETVLEPEDGFLPHQPVSLEVARGCIFRCSFCSHPFQGAKDYDSYQRTPESIARELKRNYELFGTTRYVLMDDTFNDSMEKMDRLERAIDIAKLPKFEFVSYLKPELLVTKPQMIDKLKTLGLAGGFIGLESLNNKSRKAVQKGMDVNRVIDAVKVLKQKTNAQLEASFIIGLPYDDLDSQYKTQTFMSENQDELCAGWHFSALMIHSVGPADIDRDPKKFGYTIIDSLSKEKFLFWKNDHMNFNEAIELASKLNAVGWYKRKAAGWNVATCWHLGFSDEDIRSKSYRALGLPNAGMDFERKTALELIKKFK